MNFKSIFEEKNKSKVPIKCQELFDLKRNEQKRIKKKIFSLFFFSVKPLIRKILTNFCQN